MTNFAPTMTSPKERWKMRHRKSNQGNRHHQWQTLAFAMANPDKRWTMALTWGESNQFFVFNSLGLPNFDFTFSFLVNIVFWLTHFVSFIKKNSFCFCCHLSLSASPLRVANWASTVRLFNFGCSSCLNGPHNFK